MYPADDTVLGRKVAVELLKQRSDGGVSEEAFQHERRVLASLTHPNIARLYAAGGEMRYAFSFNVPGAPSDIEDAVSTRAVLDLSITRQGRPAEGEPHLRECLKDSLANHMTAPMISPVSVCEARSPSVWWGKGATRTRNRCC